jgi:hypothetical protein
MASDLASPAGWTYRRACSSPAASIESGRSVRAEADGHGGLFLIALPRINQLRAQYTIELGRRLPGMAS